MMLPLQYLAVLFVNDLTRGHPFPGSDTRVRPCCGLPVGRGEALRWVETKKSDAVGVQEMDREGLVGQEDFVAFLDGKQNNAHHHNFDFYPKTIAVISKGLDKIEEVQWIPELADTDITISKRKATFLKKKNE